jgi:ABC-2 type transport system ATP-binding protein
MIASSTDEGAAVSLAVSRPVLKATALTKHYGKARGIEDVSFEVCTGEVFGFLGPNGAGKTTTMRVLMDAIRPTSGRAEVFGLDARDGRRDIHRRVGYLPGDFGLAERILVRDRLRYHANLRGGVDWARVEMLAKHLELDVTRQVKHLSRGNQQKAGIVQAFMSDPELLLLDEPTSGLDPLMQQAFNHLVEDAKHRGRTVAHPPRGRGALPSRRDHRRRAHRRGRAGGDAQVAREAARRGASRRRRGRALA